MIHDLASRSPLARALFAAAAACLILSACSKEASKPPPFVLLLSVDTLRSDHLGAYGNTRQLTPNLDKLAQQSLVFEAMYAPASFTVPSVSSFLTGRYPEQNAIFTNENALAADIPTLATALSSRGYATGAVVSNFVLNSKSGLDQGFDVYNEEFPQREAIRNLAERKAPDTATDALELVDGFLAAGKSHIFLWVHFQDPHGPYEPPDGTLEIYLSEARRRLGGDRPLPFGRDHRGLGAIPTYQRIDDHNQAAYYLAGYDAEIRFTDREIGRLLGGLEDRDLLDRAVVAFVADHGEGQGENDYWFAHGEYLNDELVRVPFFLHTPGGKPGRRTDIASLVDIVPTLQPLIGLQPDSALPGRNLLGSPKEESTAYLATLLGSTKPRWGLVADGFKYLRDVDGNESLYRLGVEDEDLKAEEPERARIMAERLNAMRKRMSDEVRERIDQNLTAGDREQLRMLGYVGENEDEDEE